MNWKKKLTSRKFLVAIASSLFIILTDGLDVNINSEVYWAIVTIAAIYIFGEAYIDSKK